MLTNNHSGHHPEIAVGKKGADRVIFEILRIIRFDSSFFEGLRCLFYFLLRHNSQKEIMVKTVSACFFSILFGVQSFGQLNQFPNGVYLTLDQLKKHTPAYNTTLVMQRRSAHEIRYNGGNEYRLLSKKDSLSQHYIKKKMFAYVKNDSVFLNCNEMELGPWYTLAITKGNFMAFNARDIEPDRTKNATQTGLLGYALAKTMEEINWSRYVLSLRSGYLTPLRKDYVMK